MLGYTDVTAGQAPGLAHRGQLQLWDLRRQGEPSSGRMQRFFFFHFFSFNLSFRTTETHREGERWRDGTKGHQERASASSISNACQQPTLRVPAAQRREQAGRHAAVADTGECQSSRRAPTGEPPPAHLPACQGRASRPTQASLTAMGTPAQFHLE